MSKQQNKFSYNDVILKPTKDSKQFLSVINSNQSFKRCICNQFNQNKSFQCFKCRQKTHNCVKVQINRLQTSKFQCLSCIAKSMDLVYQPKKVVLETYYKTQNIFEKSNKIIFQFDLKFQQTKHPLQIRSLKGNKIQLSWPMQGQFYFNNSKVPIFTLKPLKSNSNRKNRKQQSFTISAQLLKQGLNTLIFTIPQFDKVKYQQKYQFQVFGIYFLAVYSIKQLSKQQIISTTFRQRRHEKQKTMQIFHQGDIKIPQQKINMIDPYTCQRIKYPVRGKYCSHLRTVCLNTYVTFQKNSRLWKCPICPAQSNMFLNEPYIDIWMYEMLQDKKVSDSVFIYQNGLYEWDKNQIVYEQLDSESSSSERKDQLQSNLQNNINVQRNAYIRWTIPEVNAIDENDNAIQLQNQMKDMLNIDSDVRQRQSVQNQGYHDVVLIDYQNQNIQHQGNISINKNLLYLQQQQSIQNLPLGGSREYSSSYMEDGEVQILQIDQMSSSIDKSRLNDAFLQPIIEQLPNQQLNRQKGDSESDDSNGLVFPFQNTYDPPKNIKEIKVEIGTNYQLQKNKIITQTTKKQPQIYKQQAIEKNLGAKNIKNKSPQTNVSANPHYSNDKIQLDLIRQKIRSKLQKEIVLKKLKKIQNSTVDQLDSSQIQQSSQENQLQNSDKFIQNKRLISRPAFIKTLEQNKFSLPQKSLDPQRVAKSQSFGRVIKKNIQLSQGKTNVLNAHDKKQINGPQNIKGNNRMFPIPYNQQQQLVKSQSLSKIFPPPNLSNTPKYQQTNLNLYSYHQNPLLNVIKRQSYVNVNTNQIKKQQAPNKNIFSSHQTKFQAKSEQIKKDPRLQSLQYRQKSDILKKKSQSKNKSLQLKNTKRLVFNEISHNKFMKHYCNISIQPFEKRINDQLKKMFKWIL